MRRLITADHLKTEQEAGKAAAVNPLVAEIEKALGVEVKDVQASNLLANFPFLHRSR